MTRDEMKRLIDKTLDTQLEANRYTVENATRAVPRPPADPRAIRRLEAHLDARGICLPPSYRQFLSICDGIEGYRRLEKMNLRRANEVVEEADSDEEWDEHDPIHRFVIAAGYATLLVGFDPDSTDEQGEMKVVELSASGELTEHACFEAFLHFNLDLHEKILARERSDRANLADD